MISKLAKLLYKEAQTSSTGTGQKSPGALTGNTSQNIKTPANPALTANPAVTGLSTNKIDVMAPTPQSTVVKNSDPISKIADYLIKNDLSVFSDKPPVTPTTRPSPNLPAKVNIPMSGILSANSQQQPIIKDKESIMWPNQKPATVNDWGNKQVQNINY